MTEHHDVRADPDRIERFLRALYETADGGYLALWILKPDKTSETLWVPVGDLAAAAARAAVEVNAGNQVYFGVGLHPAPLGPHRRGTEARVCGLPGLFADVDFGPAGHTSDSLPPTPDDALALLETVPVPPTVVVHSGHGLHAYWLFPEVFAIETPEERAHLRNLNDRLQAMLRAAAAAHGWTIDSTADLARVLRPAGTVNRKTGQPPSLVRGLRANGPRTTADELDDVLPPLPRDRERSGRGDAADQGEADRPDFARIASACAYLRRWRDEAPDLTEPEWHAGMTIVALCRSGQNLAHELSAPYPNYDRDETQRKFERARQQDKPLTCRRIREERNGESSCATCPLWGRITSPIELGQPTGTFTPGGDSGSGAFAHRSYARTTADALPEPPPFPVDVFPAAIATFVTEGAAALGVPVDMIAIPTIGFAAGTIGNSRALLVKPGWVERPNLWLAVVGAPGSGKSPALHYAQQPIAALQRAAIELWKIALDRWEEEVAEAKSRKEPPPPRPSLEHFFTTDATLEALAAVLERSAGVAVIRDELVGWVQSHDQYRKGGDRQSYLSLWAGAALKVDRKGSGTLWVEHPVVPIVGGIQPDLLPALAEEANRRDGFVDRIDMVWPAADPPGWTEAAVAPRTVEVATTLFRRLRVRPKPGEDAVVAPLSPEARTAFARWYDENAALTRTPGLAGGFAAKYPGKLARFALVLVSLRYPDLPQRPVDVATIRDAIAVVEYLRGHLARILPAFATAVDGQGAGLDARVLRVLARAGGEWVPRRTLHEGLGGSVKAAELDAVLERLEADGVVELREVPTGGAPRKEARLVVPSNEHMSKGTSDDAADPSCSFAHMFGGEEASTADPRDDADGLPPTCQYRHLCIRQGPCPGLWCTAEQTAQARDTWEEGL